MEKNRKPGSKETFFTRLRHQAASLDKNISEQQRKFEEKNREFNAPEVLASLRNVNKGVKTLEASLDTDLAQIQAITTNQIVKLASSFLERQDLKISQAEIYLQQYGYKVKEYPGIKEKEIDANNDHGMVPDSTSVQATPAISSKPSSRLNRTPQLRDAGISHETMQRLQALEKQQQAVRLQPGKAETCEKGNEKDEIDCEETCLTKVDDTETEDMSNYRPRQTYCIMPAPTTPVSMNKTKKNRTPQLEDAGVSKMAIDRWTALEKNKQQEKKRVNPFNQRSQQPVPLEFQHDGIICTPSLFGVSIPDRSMLNLHEALASPQHYGFSTSETSHDIQGTAPSIFGKENITPTGPELLTQCFRGVQKEPQETSKKGSSVKLEFNSMPKSPTLFGSYNFSAEK